MNRLQHETSPYLRQHRDNPVDWFAWGDEAFQKAKAEDKPVLLSVGYSSCHWCHVMAHESFEHEETAAMMNNLFINIKVDREERPDVDDIYMQAVQAMTGRGGWPMTVFLLPDGRPFYGGTYYPLEPRPGIPAFRQVLRSVHDAYANRRQQVTEAASTLTQALDRSVLGIAGDSALNAGLLDNTAGMLAQNFDKNYGGFGGAPKFPQPMNLEFLLRTYARTNNPDMLHMVTHTLDKMAMGGIYDQIGGGFARYSVDAIWLVPHFEKMLYDNAQLSRVYLHAWQVTGNEFYRAIAEEVYDYILREMTAPEGGFYSATDADSEGEEGKFFVWSLDELVDVLGDDDARIAIEYYGISPRGNFEGNNILYVPNEPDVIADRLDIDVNDLLARVDAIKHTLYAHRSHRVHPGLDDKVLTGWNGLMLASLAEAARALDRDDYRVAAVRAGEFLLGTMQAADGRLLRTYNDGRAKLNGYLEDYANMIDALLELYQTTFDEKWFTAARGFADRILDHFAAPDGGFFDTSDDHETLIVRPRNVQDNAVPSGNGMAYKQLIRLAAYTGDHRYEEAARNALSMLANAMQQYPQAFTESLNAVDMVVNGIDEVAVVGDLADTDTQALLNVTRKSFRPNVIVALSEADVDGEVDVPLLSYRMQRGGVPTVYVCRNFTCQMPVTTVDDVESLLKGSPA